VLDKPLPYQTLTVDDKIIQTITPAKAGQFFTARLVPPGYWRLTNKDAVVYSIMILNCGAWGFLGIYDGTRRLIWAQPSAFTGSFVIEGFCKDGIIVDNGYGQHMGTNITVNWRE
jgi:hypothetical protein